MIRFIAQLVLTILLVAIIAGAILFIKSFGGGPAI